MRCRSFNAVAEEAIARTTGVYLALSAEELRKDVVIGRFHDRMMAVGTIAAHLSMVAWMRA